MKTIREWFNDLHVKVRKAAIKNTMNTANGGLGNMKAQAPNLHTALHIAFTWRQTPEGVQYWSDVARRHQEKEEELAVEHC